MNVNKIASNIYSINLRTSQNSYCSEFEFTVNTKDDRIPKGKTILDTFATGQIYMNLPKNKVLSSYSSNLITIYNSYFHEPDSPNSFNLNNQSSTDTPNWVNRYNQDGFNGWIVDTSLFFELEDNYTGIAICKNFTGTIQSGLSYQSTEYPFANVPNFSVCSSHKVAINKTTASPCAYHSNQYKCPFYEARYDVLESNSIKTYGSDQVTNYELRVSPCLAGDAIYQVVDIASNNIAYSVNVEVRSEETDLEARKVFEEVMSTYKDGFTSLTELNNMPYSSEKNSYILSLV